MRCITRYASSKEASLSNDLAAGNLAGKFERLVCKSLNRLPNALELESSPGHQVLSFKCDIALSSSDFESLQDPNLGCEL